MLSGHDAAGPLPKRAGWRRESMSGFALREDQRRVQEQAREFAEREIAPAALAVDRAPYPFPWAVVERGIRAGWTTMLIPARYGGGGFEQLTAGVVLEELGAACAGFATIFGASNLGVAPLLLQGTEEQKQRLLPKLREGERRLAAFAVTEAGAGTAAASGDPRYGPQLRAHRDGGDYVLRGAKRFITNGSVASLVTVLARTHPTKGAFGGLSFFAVEAPCTGLSVGKTESKMGQRASHTAELIFDDVRVEPANLVGREGLGSMAMLQTISCSTALVAAVCVGVGRAATEAAVRYGRERDLLEDQGFALRVADMATAVEAARTLTRRALWENDQRLDHETGRLTRAPSLKLSAMAKVFASDMCVKVAGTALDILGIEACRAPHPLEKLFRDAKLMQIYEGTNQVHRLGMVRLV
jgi:alkylation response protein AidB-like acyl-CoA dehydrogenase